MKSRVHALNLKDNPNQTKKRNIESVPNQLFTIKWKSSLRKFSDIYNNLNCGGFRMLLK